MGTITAAANKHRAYCRHGPRSGFRAVSTGKLWPTYLIAFRRPSRRDAHESTPRGGDADSRVPAFGENAGNRVAACENAGQRVFAIGDQDGCGCGQGQRDLVAHTRSDIVLMGACRVKQIWQSLRRAQIIRERSASRTSQRSSLSQSSRRRHPGQRLPLSSYPVLWQACRSESAGESGTPAEGSVVVLLIEMPSQTGGNSMLHRPKCH